MTNPTKNKVLFGIILFITIGCLLRLIGVYPPTLRYDPAGTALQAYQILTQDYRPIFWPGQAFMGSGGAYILALLFKIFGPSGIIMSFGAWIYTCSYFILTTILASKLFNQKTALWVAFLFMIPTKTILYWSGQYRPDYQICFLFVPILFLTTLYLIENSKNKNKRRLFSILLGFLSGVAMWNNMAIGPCVVTCFTFACYFLRKHILEFLVFYALGGFTGFSPVIYYQYTQEFKLFRQANFKAAQQINETIYYFTTNALPYFWGIQFKDHSSELWKWVLKLFLLWIFILYILYFKGLVIKIYKKEKHYKELLVVSYLFFHLFIASTSNFSHAFAKESHPTLYITTLYAISFTIVASVIVRQKQQWRQYLFVAPFIIYFANNYIESKPYREAFISCLQSSGMSQTYPYPASNDSFTQFCKQNDLNCGYYQSRQKKFQAMRSLNQVTFAGLYTDHFLPNSLKVDAAKNIFWAFNFNEFKNNLSQIGASADYQTIRKHTDKFQNGVKNTNKLDVPIYYNFKKNHSVLEQVKSSQLQLSETLVYNNHLIDSSPSTFFIFGKELHPSPQLEVEFKNPISLAKICFISYRFGQAPKKLEILSQSENGTKKSILKIDDGMELFWSLFHPYYKRVKPRMEINIPSYQPSKKLIIKLGYNSELKPISIQEILFYKKKSKKIISQNDLNKYVVHVCEFILSNYRGHLISGDHWFMNYFAQKGFKTEFISSDVINNQGKKNPHRLRHLPLSDQQKVFLISYLEDSPHNIKVLKNTKIPFTTVLKNNAFEVFEISQTSKLEKLYWNGLQLGYMKLENRPKTLNDLFGKVTPRDDRFKNIFSLKSFHYKFSQNREQLYFYCEINPLKEITKDYFIFLHFTNKSGDLLFQGDIPFMPEGYDDLSWQKNKPRLIERKIDLPKNLPRGIEIRLGIWLPETKRQLKVNGTDARHVDLGSVTLD